MGRKYEYVSDAYRRAEVAASTVQRESVLF